MSNYSNIPFAVAMVVMLLVTISEHKNTQAQGVFIPGVNIDPANPKGDSPTSDLADLGAQSVRLEFKDLFPRKNDITLSFPFYDKKINTYNSSGISVLVILDYDTKIGAPFGQQDWSQYIPDFVDRAKTIAQHYGNTVFAYEIWNEEDLIQTLVPPPAFGIIMQQTYAAIKSVSNAKVIFGGLASGNPNYVVFTMNATGQLNADALGIHPYGQRPTPDWPNPKWGFGVITDLLNNYAKILPEKIPFWITEDGTNDVSVQNDFPFQLFQSVSNIPRVEAVYWFCFTDNMVAPFGLLDGNGVKKGSYQSFKKFTKGITISE